MKISDLPERVKVKVLAGGYFKRTRSIPNGQLKYVNNSLKICNKYQH